MEFFLWLAAYLAVGSTISGIFEYLDKLDANPVGSNGLWWFVAVIWPFYLVCQAMIVFSILGKAIAKKSSK
jgi:hypothetical protein